MKKVKQLHAVPNSLQRFLQDFPSANRHIKDWEAFRNDHSGKRIDIVRTYFN